MGYCTACLLHWQCRHIGMATSLKLPVIPIIDYHKVYTLLLRRRLAFEAEAGAQLLCPAACGHTFFRGGKFVGPTILHCAVFDKGVG